MRVLLLLLAVAGVSAVGWFVFEEGPAAPVDVSDPTRGQAAAGPILATQGTVETDPSDPARTTLDPAAFFAALEGKEGKELAAAIGHEPWKRLPVTAEVLARLIALLRAHPHPHPATWAIRSRILSLGPTALPHLAPLLSNGTKEERLAVLFMINSWAQGEEAISAWPPMLPLLDDEDPDVQQAARFAIQWGMPFDAAIRDSMLARVRAADDYTAMNTLANMGDPAFDDYLGLFEQASTDRWRILLNCLSEVDPDRKERALEVLRQGMAHPDPGVSNLALLLARPLGPSAAPALPEARQVLRTDDEEGVRQALGLVCAIGPDAADALEDVLRWKDHPQDAIADDVAHALGAIGAGSPEARAVLVVLVRERRSDAAAQSLASFGDEGLREALALLASEDPDVKYAALWTLARLGEAAAAAAPRLVPLIRQEDDVLLRQRAIGTAGFIGPRADIVVPAIMVSIRSALMPLEAADAGGSMARLGPKAREAIRAGLRSGDPTVRLRSAEMLHWFHGTSHFALDDLEPLLASKSVPLRRAALVAIRTAVMFRRLDGVRYPSLVDDALHARLRPIFTRMQEDPDARVAAYARAGLVQLGMLAEERAAGALR